MGKFQSHLRALLVFISRKKKKVGDRQDISGWVPGCTAFRFWGIGTRVHLGCPRIPLFESRLRPIGCCLFKRRFDAPSSFMLQFVTAPSWTQVDKWWGLLRAAVCCPRTQRTAIGNSASHWISKVCLVSKNKITPQNRGWTLNVFSRIT